MSVKPEQRPQDYIVPLNMNGLEGRMMRLPAKKAGQQDILFIYGQHSSLERWWGLAQALNKLGSVTMPDLPGFGGMTSLYKIGQTASVDNLADYLAAFIKLKYRNRKVTIAAMSLGFVITTRMLQKYPELTKRVDNLVSIVGFSHHDDFIFSGRRKVFYRLAARFFSRRLPSAFFRLVFLNPYYLRRAYKHSKFAKEKLSNLSKEDFKKTMDTELVLWSSNDIRTQMKTNVEMFTLNDTNTRIDLPVYHVASKKDRYFNHVRVEEHFRRIFTDVKVFYTKDPNHAPTIIANAKQAEPFIPPGLKRILMKKASKKL